MVMKMIDGITTKKVKSTDINAQMLNNTKAKGKVTKNIALSTSTPAAKKAKSIDIASAEPKKVKTTKTAVKKKTASPAKTKEEKYNEEEALDSFLKPVTYFDLDDDEEEVVKKDKKTKARKSEEEKEPKKFSKKRKIIISILVAIFLLLASACTALILWGNDIIAKITGGRGNIMDAIGLFVGEQYDPLKTDINGRTNILAFGTSGYDMEGSEGGVVHDGAQLTDSIMAISIDQETGDAVMLSIPRDFKARPTCTATGKINEVYWCNNIDGDAEEKGANALMQEVGSILGWDFQYYVHVNWESLIDIVDILGGITVTLDESIAYDYINYDGSNIVAVLPENTPTELTGRAALGVARARKDTKMGDFSRGNNQQKILMGIKDKFDKSDLNVTDLIDIASTLGDNLRTNFSVSELKSAANIAFTVDFETMRQIPLVDYDKDIYYVSSGMIDGISYVYPAAGVGVYGPIREYVAKIIRNNPAELEEASILVLNGTEVGGIASKEKKILSDLGYNKVAIDDAPENYSEKYTIYANSANVPATVKDLESRYAVNAKDFSELAEDIYSDNYDVVIIIGGMSETE